MRKKNNYIDNIYHICPQSFFINTDSICSDGKMIFSRSPMGSLIVFSMIDDQVLLFWLIYSFIKRLSQKQAKQRYLVYLDCFPQLKSLASSDQHT